MEEKKECSKKSGGVLGDLKEELRRIEKLNEPEKNAKFSRGDKFLTLICC